MMGILSGWGTKIMSMKDGQFLDIRHFSFDCAIGTLKNITSQNCHLLV